MSLKATNFQRLLFFYTQGKSSGLQSNTKASSAAVHYKQLHACFPDFEDIATPGLRGIAESTAAGPSIRVAL